VTVQWHNSYSQGCVIVFMASVYTPLPAFATVR
jgi:hypothetical protein